MGADMKKKLIKSVTKYNVSQPQGQLLDDYISYLKNIEQEQIKGYNNVGWNVIKTEINLDHVYDYYDEFDELQLSFYLERLETDKELKSRIVRSERAKVAAQKRKEKKEQQERELLKKLKDKYEN